MKQWDIQINLRQNIEGGNHRNGRRVSQACIIPDQHFPWQLYPQQLSTRSRILTIHALHPINNSASELIGSVQADVRNQSR